MTQKPDESEDVSGERSAEMQIEALMNLFKGLQDRIEDMQEDFDGPGDGKMSSPQSEPERWIPGGGGGDSLDGYEIYRAGGTRFHVTTAQAMTGYDSATHDNWSLEFGVTSSALDDYAEGGSPVAMTNPIGTSTVNEPSAGTELLHDADASADPVDDQEYYRLPIIRDGKRVSFGGAYRENLIVQGDKGPVVELIRI